MAIVDGVAVEYVLRPAGPRLAVIFHGGHLRADLDIGQEAFVGAGCSVLQLSRPGYGRTPLSAGPDDASFADRIASLCALLGYDEVLAVGVSAGGRAAMTFAARHPHTVTAIVLESSTSSLPWPGPATRAVATIAFRPHVERATWAITRLAFGLFPEFMLRLMLSSLSTLPGRTAYDALQPDERSHLVVLLSGMRSGRGFFNDLRGSLDVTSSLAQPTLIVASRHDGAVRQDHPRALAATIADARLVMTDAVSHFLWVGPHADQERDAVGAFLEEFPGRSVNL